MIFRPTDQTDQERDTNSRFAAIKEVDTSRPTFKEIRNLMSEKPRTK